MATSKLFKKVPITVPNRSGFNMSHNNFFSAPVGTLIPNFIDFLIPGDEIDLSSKVHVQLPPMATDFYGRVEAKEEAFFVPCRILFGGWKDFYVNPVDGTTNPNNIDGQLAKYLIGATFSSSSPGKLTYTSAQTAATDVNATRIRATVSSSATAQDVLAKLQEICSTCLEDFRTLVSDEFDTIFPTPQFSFDAGAGSLLDYLGFKINYFNNLSKLYTQSFLLEAYDYLNSHYLDAISTISGPNMAFDTALTYTVGDKTVSLEFRRLSSYVFTQVYVGGKSFTQSYNIPNILPLIAYHKIYDDWYRAPQIQQSLFKRNVANQSTATSVANMPWITSGADNKIYFTGDQLKFANGHSLFNLHQRNWQKDYFTSATPEPQAGEAASVKFDVENDSGEFTIASLRAANSLQQFLDRSNIGGFRYGDMIYAQYGVYPSDAITDRAIYLGSSTTEVYNKSIYQQSGDGGTDTNNPFNAIGSKYSNPTGIGQGNFCNNYKVTEAGFVIKIYSLVPQAYYSTGVRRFFMHNDISDIAFPVLSGVGDQPIFGYELTDAYSGDGDKTVFGYVQRYADYKFIDDQVHGLLRDGQSLDSFALQRSFIEPPELGSDFLQIPRNYLDQVSATSYKLSEYGCWVNCYNDYRKSSTLPAYSIPTLEDMKGHTVMVEKGGSYLD